jgi:3-hydroxyisobutyrate dehydrogenase-like beta-hydroxyacid dehydrogenase
MGSAIVQRLRAAGFEVTGYDVDADKRARLAQSGAAPADSLAALREQCTTIMLAVFNTDQVEAVIEGSDGLLSLRGPAKSRPVFICTSTCDPDRIAQLAARIESRADYIEMPVSGTSAQARGRRGSGPGGRNPVSCRGGDAGAAGDMPEPSVLGRGRQRRQSQARGQSRARA